MQLLIVCFVLIPVLLLEFSCVGGIITCDSSSTEREEISSKAINYLNSLGYTVEIGFQYFLLNSTIFGANPSSPYGVYSFTVKLPIPLQWRMSPNDAVVWFGCTPPKSKYFSFRSYDYLSPLPSPRFLFASLGDSLNHLVLNSTGSSGSDFFQKTAIVLTTADRNTDAIIRAAFSESGFEDSFINTDVIPSSLVNIGTSLLSDEFLMLYRVSGIEDPQEASDYYNSEWPIYYFSPPSSQPLNPFPVPTLRPRGTGKGEQYLESSLSNLITTVINTYVQKNYVFVSKYDTFPIHLDGFDCLKERTDCYGDNRDTLYLSPSNLTNVLNITLSPLDVFVVAGVNHALAKGLAYSNFALYAVDPQQFFKLRTTDEVVTNAQYEGSATFYAPDLPNVGLLYAYAFARECPARNVSDKFCLQVDTNQIKEGEVFDLIERTYLEIATKTAPLDTELVKSQLLHFLRN